MAKPLVILAVLGSATLAGCSNPSDPNEKNFGAALSQYFVKKGQLCLNQRRVFPVTVTDMDLKLQQTTQTGTAGQMVALEAAGLVECTASGNGRLCSLTDAAQPFIQEREATSWGVNGSTKVTQIDLCWGQKAIDKIVKWEGPMKFGDYQEARLTYTYKLDNTAEWARKPEIQAAFPLVKSTLEGAGSRESKHAVKLTNQGWEAKGLD